MPDDIPGHRAVAWALFVNSAASTDRTVADLASAFAYGASQGWLARDLNGLCAEPNAREKVYARRAFRGMIQARNYPADDLSTDRKVLDALAAAPDQWLAHSATKRFLQNWSRGKTLPPEETERYAAICIRLHGGVP